MIDGRFDPHVAAIFASSSDASGGPSKSALLAVIVAVCSLGAMTVVCLLTLQ